MNEFEYVLTLFGLLLGLALTEALSGLSRAIKVRHEVRIGWSTALIGAVVACDVVTFWMFGWSLRSAIAPTWPMMFAGFLVTAVYFVSASLIFPEDPRADYEAHFAANYRFVLGGVLLCNAVLFAWVVSLVGVENLFSFRAIVLSWSLFPVAALALIVRKRATVIVCLCWLLALYPLSTIWE